MSVLAELTRRAPMRIVDLDMNFEDLWRSILGANENEPRMRELLLCRLAAELRPTDLSFKVRLSNAAYGGLSDAVAVFKDLLGWGWEVSCVGFARIYPPDFGLTCDDLPVNANCANGPGAALLLAAFSVLDWQRVDRSPAAQFAIAE